MGRFEGRFDGQVLLVTGAGKGIGAAVAAGAAREGARIAAFDVDESALAPTADRIRADGGQVISIQGDARARADVERAVEVALREYGGLDGLAAIAGVLRLAPADQTPDEHWRDVVETNVRGPFLFAGAVIPHLRRRGGGSIVMAASAMAFASSPGAALYSASKGAIVSLTKALAVECAAERIRVNCVAPGTVRTPMARELAESIGGGGDLEKIVEDFGKGHPIGRILEPEEIARVILFLLSTEASAVTGSCYVADGGLLASLA